MSARKSFLQSLTINKNLLAFKHSPVFECHKSTLRLKNTTSVRLCNYSTQPQKAFFLEAGKEERKRQQKMKVKWVWNEMMIEIAPINNLSFLCSFSMWIVRLRFAVLLTMEMENRCKSLKLEAIYTCCVCL